MYRLLSLFVLVTVLVIGSSALAQDTVRSAPAAAEETTRRGGEGSTVHQRLTNNTNGQNQYTGSGSCDCTGGGNQTYSGCDNAGTNIWVNGTYDPSGSQAGKACADAACAAAGKGSCSLLGLVMNTTGSGPDATVRGDEAMEVQERVVR